jgi:predicted dehydrogenase
MFKIAVVGVGFIGQSHIAAIAGIEDAEVVAVVDTKDTAREAAAAEWHCRAYATLEDAVLNEEVDLVDVCLPTVLHEQFVVKAASLGKHVLCEKPVTFTLESFDRMVAACEKSKVCFMVAQVARWWPEFAVIKEYVDSGKLGSVRMVYEKRLAQHPNWTEWHKDPAVSGGGLFDMNIHDIDFLYTLFGMPKKIYAVGWQSGTGCWNHIAADLKWESAQAICETSMAMTGDFPFSIELRVGGDKGTIGYAFSAGHNLKDGDVGSDFNWYPEGGGIEALSAEQTDMYRVEIEAFLEAIREDKPAPVTATQVRDVLTITLAIEKSLKEGVVVEL